MQEKGRSHELQPEVQDGDERDAEQEEEQRQQRVGQGREERHAVQADVHGLIRIVVIHTRLIHTSYSYS